jgi:hypothetical protein
MNQNDKKKRMLIGVVVVSVSFASGGRRLGHVWVKEKKRGIQQAS